jgi:mono/diheme cytochrome c family protein
MSRRSARLAALAAAAVGLASAATVFAAGTPDDASASGAQLFASRCAMCHRAGGMGTGILSRRPNAGAGLLEERRDLAADFIKAVARAGTGNMPRISRGEVSDAQLARIAAYLAREPQP